MNSKLKYAVIFLIIFPFLNILGDRTSIKPDSKEPDACQTDFDPNSTMITFYGDSLGDLIDFPGGYGYFGWEWYLSVHDTSVRWDIQNLAKNSNRTQQVYDLISGCAADTVRRKNFRTADNVAIEIGGNDYLSNVTILYYMPWKFSDVDQRVTYNTRVIVRALRNSLRNKNILVMGNFPIISKSPLLGEMGDYFTAWKYFPDGQIIDKNKQFRDSLVQNQLAEDLKASLNVLMQGLIQSYDSLVNFITHATGLNFLDKLSVIPDVNSRTGKDLWYWKHLADWKETPGSLISIGLMFHQLSLMSMVEEENNTEYNHTYTKSGENPVNVPYLKGKVQFISLYGFFSFPPDAQADRYYVANPGLFADPIHINHIGYYNWAKHITPKFGNLGWKNLPEPTLVNGESCRTWNCGSAEEPPYGGPIVDPLPQPVEVTPSEIDWLLLICIFTGKCW